jgi:dipeptidyl aminopeptidase/acylaminoacyl peptidase
MAATRTGRIEIDDLARLRFPSSPAIAPDGRSLVYVEKRVGLEKNRYYHDLMLVDLRTGAIHDLTPGDHSDTEPCWTPDSRGLVFVSDRSGSSNLWRISIAGGEAEQLTKLDGLVSTPRVNPAAPLVAFQHAAKTAAQRMLEGGRNHNGPQYRHMTRLGYKLDGHGYWSDAWLHLYVLDLRTRRVRQITSGKNHDGQHAWSPNGRMLAFVSNRIPRADFHINNSDIFVVAAVGGAARQITKKRGPKMAPTWSPDGKHIAFIGHTSFPDAVENNHVFVVPARGGTAIDLVGEQDIMCNDSCISDTKDVPEGTAPAPVWSRDGKRIAFLASVDGGVNVHDVPASGGAVRQRTFGKHEISEFTQSSDGASWAFTRLDPTSPGDVWLARFGRKGGGDGIVPDADAVQLTSVNKNALRGKNVGRPKEFRVKSRDGHAIHGWVLQARGEARRAPAVLMVHGGPYAMYGWSFFHEFQVLAAAGYHVFYTNIQGSIGYGRAYMRALVGNWGHVDFRDVTDVADWMEEQPYVDKQRLAIAGGSYGGYMTNWAAGHTNRFKCAITMRSVVNMLSFLASDIGWDFHEEFASHPWENYERYWRTSPIAFVHQVRTPLLILHSDEDHRCPVTQAEELFVALKVLNRDVEMVRFVGESHGLSRSGRPHNRLERLRRIVDWFERKL